MTSQRPSPLPRSFLNRSGLALLDAVAPRRCRLCQVIVRGDCALCGVCRGELQHNRHPCARCALPLPGPLPPATVNAPARLCPRCLAQPPQLTAVVAPFVYDEALGFLVSRWKYHGEVALAHTFARLWLDAASAPPAVDLLLPVPLHWRRLLARGFNQSADLSELLGAQLELPANPRRPVLRRVAATPAQAQADRHERLHNLRGVFALRGSVEGRRIALVDDVCTTGATAEAAARALLNGGAAAVYLWCVARTPTHEPAWARATLSR